MNLQEPFTLKGLFNPAGDPENQLIGDLTFSQQDGTDVTLFGGFEINNGKSPATLYHGFSTKGKKMTLIDNSPSMNSVSIPGIMQTGIHARYLLFGDWYYTSESIAFDVFRFTCKDLNHWLNITGFQKPIYDRKNHEVHVNYKNPETRIFALNSDIDLHIEFEYWGPPEFFIPSEKITIEQKPYFKIISKNGKLPFEKFIECYNSLLCLLSFCYFGFPVTTECTFKREDHDEVEMPIGDIEIYYWSAMNFEKYKPHLNRQDFLILFTDIEDSFSPILNNWFILQEKIKVGINLLTELFMYRNSPIELRFLSMAQAAEHLHRELINNDNKILFQQRIEELLSRIPADVSDALVTDAIKFAATIRKNRNYFTHYNKKQATDANRLTDVDILGEKMKIILLTIVLQELGIPNTKVSDIILNRGQWLYNRLINKEDNKQP